MSTERLDDHAEQARNISDLAAEATSSPTRDSNETTLENTTGNALVEVSNKEVDDTSEYIAPFYPYDGVPLRPCYYAVTFVRAYTRKQHWEAIGENLGPPGTDSWYSATLTPEQIDRIRRDPGVKKVRQNG